MRACECFVHLLLCEEEEEGGGDTICFSTDWTLYTEPPLDDKQREGDNYKTYRGFAVPTPLVPAILKPQWSLDIRGLDTTTTTTTPDLS